jgi:hypothetical protein
LLDRARCVAMRLRTPEQMLAYQFLITGMAMLRVKWHHLSLASRARRFRDNFKWGPGRLAHLYMLIKNHPILRGLVRRYEPKDLLWTFYFLLSSAPERRICTILGADRKTIRKIKWPTIIAIASLAPELVSAILSLLSCNCKMIRLTRSPFSRRR